ncbi:MAG: transglutaminase-like domain-containing protein [Janthinobacterium lividum]
MLIKSEFDIQFQLPGATPMVALLHLHPSLDSVLRSPDTLVIEHSAAGTNTRIEAENYLDSFGNRCARFHAPPGNLRLSGQNIVEATAEPEQQPTGAVQHSVDDLPAEVLQFLLASRYCEVDRFSAIAYDLFGNLPPGGERALSIRDWVHWKVRFDYAKARPTKTAMDVFTEREGVCRDFQHLAITLSRALNIPARYVTGHVGDIRIPLSGAGDFSAWYQVYLGGRWWDMDARHNYSRLGRLLMATGRDAADVAITTSFGIANLTHFFVESNEMDADGNRVPLPPRLTNAVQPAGGSGPADARGPHES